FFSSRRRHTRCYRDWSSDVCSSDLGDWCQYRPTVYTTPPGRRLATLSLTALGVVFGDIGTSPLYAFRACFNPKYGLSPTVLTVRSEERRVGKVYRVQVAMEYVVN